MPDVLDRVVFGHAFADHAPGHAIRAQEVDLGVGDDKRGVGKFDHNIGDRQCRFSRIGVGRLFGLCRGRACRCCSHGDKSRRSARERLTPGVAVIVVTIVLFHQTSPLWVIGRIPRPSQRT